MTDDKSVLSLTPTLALALLLAAAAAWAPCTGSAGPAGGPSGPGAGPGGAPAGRVGGDGGLPGLEVRAGRVTRVDPLRLRVTIEGGRGATDFGYDRNTVVYLPGRLGTIRDVAPGTEIRASIDPSGLAAFIEVRPPRSEADGGGVPPSAPDGGAAHRSQDGARR